MGHSPKFLWPGENSPVCRRGRGKLEWFSVSDKGKPKGYTGAEKTISVGEAVLTPRKKGTRPCKKRNDWGPQRRHRGKEGD